MRRRRRAPRRGHLLVGLLVLVAVSSIVLAKAVPSWQTAMKRDREEELIFRGEAYAEAIRYFQKKNGRLPVSLEEIHKKPVNCIRKLYKDPMTKSEEGKWGGEWGVIFASPTGQPILPGQGPPAPGGGRPGGSDPGGGAGGGTPGGGTASPSPSPTLGSTFGASAGGGPIIGVYSRSDEDSIKLYEGKDKYSEWFFVMKPDQPQRPPGGPGGGGGTPPPAPPPAPPPKP